jgi:peptidoglycan hydrolase-like protein with peptidoglycan-binding domain
MNEDYIDLDMNLAHLLVVACINSGDPTRYRNDATKITFIPPDGSSTQGNATTQGNTWLTPICQSLTLAEIEKLQATALAAVTAIPKLQPVNPELAVVQPAAAPNARQPAPSTSKQAGDATVLAVQKALQALDCPGCYPGPADGIVGKDTQDAVSVYQKTQGLKVNGDPKDADTLYCLKVKSAGPAPSPPPSCKPTGA